MISPKQRAALEVRLAGWGVRLDEARWALLANYLQDVLEYNKKVNLTAAAGADEILERHFADALAALPALRERLGKTPSLLEVGAGAGFVGICLKIAWPEAHVTLMESVYRKFCFLNWTGARLGLPGLRVLNERAGTKPPAKLYDAVLARALAPLPEALGLTLPLTFPDGLSIVYQTQAPDPQEPALAKRLALSGGRIEDVRAYRLPGEEADRHLVLVRRNG